MPLRNFLNLSYIHECVEMRRFHTLTTVIVWLERMFLLRRPQLRDHVELLLILDQLLVFYFPVVMFNKLALVSLWVLFAQFLLL